MSKRDYYDVLGVPRTASAEDIRRAHRRLVRQLHPDVNKAPDAAGTFALVQEAYEVLSEPDKRQRYDQFGHAGVHATGVGGAHKPGTYTWSNVGGHPAHPGADFDEFEVESLFESFFGGRGAPRPGAHAGRRGGRARQVVERDLAVDFLTAARGGTQELRLTTPTGKPRTIEVRIPKAAPDGLQLRIAKAISESGHDVDLVLTLRVQGHAVLRRSPSGGPAAGLDLYVDLPLTIAEATLGAEVPVPTLSGRVELRVPPGSGSGRMLRLRGKGLEDDSGARGDLYAVLKIVTPDAAALSDADKQALRDIASRAPNPRDDFYRGV